MMLSDPKAAIDEITKRLILAAQPIRIILFGSFARGTAGQDSDIDILVVETGSRVSGIKSKSFGKTRLKKLSLAKAEITRPEMANHFGSNRVKSVVTDIPAIK